MDELLIVDELMTAEELSAHEVTIQRGKQTFVEVGKALREIRDRKGYRHTHGTFADYVTNRWAFSVSTGYNLIAASELSENVHPGGQIGFKKAVAVSGLPPQEQRAFVDQHDLEAMTKREVEKAVAAWKKRTEKAERERDEAVEQGESLLESNSQTLAQLTEMRKLKTPEPVTVIERVEVNPPDYEDIKRRVREQEDKILSLSQSQLRRTRQQEVREVIVKLESDLGRNLAVLQDKVIGYEDDADVRDSLTRCLAVIEKTKREMQSWFASHQAEGVTMDADYSFLGSVPV